jgi:hypothetical protein
VHLRDLQVSGVFERASARTNEPPAGKEERHMMRLMRKALCALLVAAAAVALTATPVRAGDSVRIEGPFTVSYMGPSAVDYCAASGGDLSIEAQGIGRISGLGPMFLVVKKCFRFADFTYAGTFTMTVANGDTLHGIYAGTQSPPDENGFGPFQGTLTVTGGTGRFRHARGALDFTAVASPASVGAGPAPTANGTAYYLVRGSMVSPEKH